MTDASTCSEVEQAVAVAIDEARSYIGTGNDDPALAEELVLTLSAADARPECLDPDTADQARGLRTTIATG